MDAMVANANQGACKDQQSNWPCCVMSCYRILLLGTQVLASSISKADLMFESGHTLSLLVDAGTFLQ
jgi:hypothetical protein